MLCRDILVAAVVADAAGAGTTTERAAIRQGCVGSPPAPRARSSFVDGLGCFAICACFCALLAGQAGEVSCNPSEVLLGGNCPCASARAPVEHHLPRPEARERLARRGRWAREATWRALV